MKLDPKHIVQNITAKLMLAFLLMLSASNIKSQSVEAYSTLDSSSIMIGDQIGMEIGIQIPNNFDVSWPILADTINSHIEIIKKDAIDTVSNNGQTTILQRLLITSFDSGYFEIQPIEFIFHNKADSSNYFTANTNTMFIQVRTPEVDTSKAFMAIKGPVEEPYTFMEVLPWILLSLAIIGIIIGGIWYLRKRKRNQPVFAKKAKPALPPHVVAIEKLEQLRLAKIWQQGRLKEYYTELTDITREYVERRYHFDALEMTTEEILTVCKEQSINESARGKLKSVLQLADLVKFAKEKPTALENDLSLNHCIDFVQETKMNLETSLDIETELPPIKTEG